MDINDLTGFERLRSKYRDFNRAFSEDLSVHRQIAEVDRVQREIDKFQRDQKTLLQDRLSKPVSDISRLAQETIDRSNRMLPPTHLDQARKAMDNYDRVREQADRALQISRDIARLQDADRRFQQFEYAQKRIAEFEKTQKQVGQLEEFQRSLNDRNRLLERIQASHDSSFRTIREAAKSASSPFGHVLRESAAKAAAYLDPIQQRAANAFALTEREASALKTRLNEAAIQRPRQDYFRDVLRSHELFADSIRARDSFLNELTRHVRTAVVESETEEEAIGRIADIVNEKIKEPPKGISTVELIVIILGVAQIVLALLPALYQIHVTNYQIAESQKSGQEQKEFNQKLLSVLSEIAEHTERPEVEGLPYLVERVAEVKNRPNFRSRTIDRIPSGTRVRVLLVEHKWVFVEYAESLDLEPRSGWVSKKFLRRLGR